MASENIQSHHSDCTKRIAAGQAPVVINFPVFCTTDGGYLGLQQSWKSVLLHVASQTRNLPH